LTIVFTVLAVLLSCLACTGSPATAQTDLRITLWPQGVGTGSSRSWRLRCEPPGGTLPAPAAACRRLAGLTRPFARVPPDMACIEIYGGPQEARVTGTFRGRRIWATFRRTDGCEVDRWKRHDFLFPGVS
jgi:hypothetical protein